MVSSQMCLKGAVLCAETTCHQYDVGYASASAAPTCLPTQQRISQAVLRAWFLLSASCLLLPQNRSAFDSRSSASAEPAGGDGSDATSEPDVPPGSSAAPVAFPGVELSRCAGAAPPAATLPGLGASELAAVGDAEPPAASVASSCRAASAASDSASCNGGSGAGAKPTCCPCLHTDGSSDCALPRGWLASSQHLVPTADGVL
jgi:hypothetical protein